MENIAQLTTSIRREKRVQIAFKQSFIKHGYEIIAGVYPLKARGYAFRLLGEQFIVVNAKLPRAERSAFIQHIVKGGAGWEPVQKEEAKNETGN